MGHSEENNVLLVPGTEHKEDQNPVEQTKQFKVTSLTLKLTDLKHNKFTFVDLP